MLYETTVDPKTLDLIQRLSNDARFNDFILVGGTALSLKVGHRISIDIDLFINDSFDSRELGRHLVQVYKAEDVKTLKNGVFCFVNDIKVDLISHQYPWIFPHSDFQSIRIASLEDIAAMKINAIVQSGSRLKDFVDIFFLLEHFGLEEILNFYVQKYPETSRMIGLNALLFHSDIKPVGIDFIGQPISFKKISQRLSEAAIEQKKVFPRRLEE